MQIRVKQLLKAFKASLPEALRRRIVEMRCFGSHARGEAHPESDLDLLVVLDEVDESIRDQILDTAYSVMTAFDFTPLLSLHILSRKEYERIRAAQTAFYRQLQSSGIPL